MLPDSSNLTDTDVHERAVGCKILITGASGFVGKSLIRRIRERGIADIAEVWGLSRTQPPCELSDGIAGWLTCDLQSETPPGRDWDFIIHLATPLSSDAASSPMTLAQQALTSAHNLVRTAATQVRPPTFLFASSGAVYGTSYRRPVREYDPWLCDANDQTDEYAGTKRLLEALLSQAHGQGILNLKICRLFSFIGPDLPLNGNFAIGNFLADAIAGRPIIIRGTGRPVRGYLHQDDMADWLLAAVFRGADRGIYNVGSSYGIPLLAAAEMVAHRLGLSVLVDGSERADNSRSYYVPDTSRTQFELGLEPGRDLQTAIHDTLDTLQGKGKIT